jgi:hypothetical protein
MIFFSFGFNVTFCGQNYLFFELNLDFFEDISEIYQLLFYLINIVNLSYDLSQHLFLEH